MCRGGHRENRGWRPPLSKIGDGEYINTGTETKRMIENEPTLIKGTIKIETFKDASGDRSIEFRIKLKGKINYESERLEIMRLFHILTNQQ